MDLILRSPPVDLILLSHQFALLLSADYFIPSPFGTTREALNCSSCYWSCKEQSCDPHSFGSTIYTKMDYPKASMPHSRWTSQSSPLYWKRKKRSFKVPDPSSADILPLNFTPSRLSTRGTRSKSLMRLQASTAIILTVEAICKDERRSRGQPREKGESIFRHVFGTNCECFFNYLKYNI